MGEVTRDALVEKMSENIERDRIEGSYSASQKRKILFLLGALVLMIVSFTISLAYGSVRIPFGNVLQSLGHALMPSLISEPNPAWHQTIVMNANLPRTMLCLLTGICLATAGTVMQGLLRNPLVSPFTLGVSTAASFGAAMTIAFGSSVLGTAFYKTSRFMGVSITTGDMLIVVFAFLCGMASILLVLAIAKKDSSRSTLVLSGVVISYLFQAGISSAKYLSDDEALREISNWLMGGMWNATWGAVIIILPVCIVCVLFMEYLALKINSLSAGDDIARNVGVDVHALRKQGLVTSTLMTSVCVAFTGVIGFIGLMAPHMCRMAIGNDTRFIIPAASMIGATILMVSDTFARNVIRPDQLPVGIILYIIGGIFFIWMVSRKRWGGRL